MAGDRSTKRSLHGLWQEYQEIFLWSVAGVPRGLSVVGGRSTKRPLRDRWQEYQEVFLWSAAGVPRRLSVAREPKGLSVNEAHNVLVACYKAKRIQEYTTHGTLVRDICLKAGVTSPWHAVQLTSGHYVVSQNASPGVVSVVTGDGQVVHSCKTEMKYPTSIAVKQNDLIHVADSANDRILTMDRILAMDSSLRSVEELALPADDEIGLRRPSGLCLDESRGRLYVGEYDGSLRVLVIDNVRL